MVISASYWMNIGGRRSLSMGFPLTRSAQRGQTETMPIRTILGSAGLMLNPKRYCSKYLEDAVIFVRGVYKKLWKGDVIGWVEFSTWNEGARPAAEINLIGIQVFSPLMLV